MTQINSEVLKQFGEKGLSINEGIAIDARLVQSASRPVSSDQLKQLREKRRSDRFDYAIKHLSYFLFFFCMFHLIYLYLLD